MKNLLRVLKWLAIGLSLLLVLLVLGVTFYTRTENFDRWARDQAIAAINSTIRGSLSVARLSGSVWSKLILDDVVLRHEDAEIARIPRVEISFSLWPLLWGELQIARVDAARPRANLRQDRENRWNIIEALSPREPDQNGPSNITVLVKELRLQDGDIDLHARVTENEKRYRLQKLSLKGRADILPARTSVEVSAVAAVLTSIGQPELSLKGALEYRRAPDSQELIKIDNFWAVSRNSRVKLNGEIFQGQATKIKAQASVDKLAPVDIDYFVRDWPLRRELTGSVNVDGPLEALEGKIEIMSAGAKVTGKFRADVTRDPLPYQASAALSGIDLRQWLGNKDFAGVVNGTVEAAGTGFVLQNTAGKARLEVRSTAVQGWTLGTVSMDGRLQDSVASVNGRLQSDLGGADWSGKISLGGKQPNYDLTLSIKDLNTKNVPGGNAPPTKLNFQATINGSGLNPAVMSARAEAQIMPSSVGAVQIKQGALSLAVSDKKLRIARATLDTAESALTVNGEIGLDQKMAGKLDYRLRVADLSPWLALIKRQGSGALDLVGEARGNLTDLQSQGTARLAKLRAEGIAVNDGTVQFSLQGSKDLWFPQGVVTARLADVDAGIGLRHINGTAKLSRQPAQSLQLSLNAQDNSDRKHSLNGDIGFSADTIALRLNQFLLTAPDGAWRLARPVMLTKRGDNFSIEQFSMRNGDRELAVNGRIGLAGNQDVDLKIDRLPVETLMAFFSWQGQPKMSGLLAAQARISGTAAAPEIAASARLTDAKIGDQAYSGANAEATYKNKRANLSFTVQQDATHSLNGAGAAPLDLSWNNGWRAEFADGLELRAQSPGLSVAFLNAFGGKSVEGINGEINLDLFARGSVKKPDLRGTFALRDGRLKVVPLGVDIQQVTATGSLDSRHLTLRELSARAKDGEIRGSGALALKDYDIDTVQLSLTAARWPAVDTTRHQLKIAGNVDVQGTLAAPRIKGQVAVTEGNLRPDLEFLEQGKVPSKRDDTIVVVSKGVVSRPSTRPGQQNGNLTASGILKNVGVDVTLSAPGNVWIRHPNFVSELSGNVHVAKRPERDFDLTGRIDIIRGWYALQGRRLQLTRGTIQFTGGDKINPSLDIAAEYRLPEYQVEAVIGGNAEKPTLTLSSQPRLDQADVLAVLLFGKPINTLNRNEQGALQQSALSITSGFVAGKIASSVSTALGLDSLGLDIGEVEFSGGRVGFGRYVGSKTYVTASQELSGEHGQQVGLEYQFAPDWKVGTSTSSTGSNGIDIIWHKRY